MLRYFPDALIEIAKVIQQGKLQHKTTGWARDKSTDHEAAALRHLIDSQYENLDSDGVLHLAKFAWRALATLQTHAEKHGAALAPASVRTTDAPAVTVSQFAFFESTYPYPTVKQK